MKPSISVRRAAAVLTVFGVLCAVTPPVRAQEFSFQASAEYAITFNQGYLIEGLVSGTARPWGTFTGTAEEFAKGVSGGVGVVEMEFGAGTLTLGYQTVNVSGSGFAGTWFVLDGTGVFSDAVGAGDLFLLATGGGMGVIDFDGKISL